MYAVTKFLAQKIPLAKFQYIVLKNRSNEIRIRRELPVIRCNLLQLLIMYLVYLTILET